MKRYSYSEVVKQEHLIQIIVQEIKKELIELKDVPSSSALLKELGRFTLKQLPNGQPRWAMEYQNLFKK